MKIKISFFFSILLQKIDYSFFLLRKKYSSYILNEIKKNRITRVKLRDTVSARNETILREKTKSVECNQLAKNSNSNLDNDRKPDQQHLEINNNNKKKTVTDKKKKIHFYN